MPVDGRAGQGAEIRAGSRHMPAVGSRQFVAQRLGLFQIWRVKAFGEPGVDGCQEVAGFGAAALVAAERGEAHGGAQFPELGPLLRGNAQGFTVQPLGGLGMPLPKQQLAIVPVQLPVHPARPCSFDDLQSIVKQGERFLNLPCSRACPRQEGDIIRNQTLCSGGAVSVQTAAQERHSLDDITIFHLDPTAIDRPGCTPECETLLGCYCY